MKGFAKMKEEICKRIADEEILHQMLCLVFIPKISILSV